MLTEHFFQFSLAQITDMSQPCICPGIGTVENYELIARIENDITIIRMSLHILAGKDGSQRANLLESAVHGHLNRKRV